MLRSNVLELANLVRIQVFVIGPLPPLVTVLASIDVTLDFARVQTESYKNEGEESEILLDGSFLKAS